LAKGQTTVGPKTRLLCDRLQETISRLEGVEERPCAERLRRHAHLIAGGDYEGIERLSREFGGMGSLNDLVIHPRNGHTVAAADISPVNERLQALRSEIHDLVGLIRRNPEIRRA
jgi:hypothetical protein